MMIEEMTTQSLVAYALNGEESTEMEMELADRLRDAVHEIDRLVDDRNKLLCELHQKLEAIDGNT